MRGKLFACAFAAATAGLVGNAVARDLVVAIKTEPSSMDPQYHALTPNICEASMYLRSTCLAPR